MSGFFYGDQLLPPFGVKGDAFINTASTASNLTNYGLWSASNSTAGGTTAYTIDAPVAGRLVAIGCQTISTSTGTDSVTVQAASGTFDGTNNLITFNAAGDGVTLLGASTSRYLIVGVNSISLSTA